MICGGIIDRHKGAAPFPAKLGAAICARGAECCSPAGFAGPLATCVADRSAHYKGLAAHARSLGAPFDAATAAACLAAVQTPEPRCPTTKDSLWGPLDCLDVYRGAKPAGATCEGDWGECALLDGRHGTCVTIVSNAGEGHVCKQVGLVQGECYGPEDVYLEWVQIHHGRQLIV